MLTRITPDQVKIIADKVGTPCFVYDEVTLKGNVERVMRFAEKHGLRTRLKLFVPYFANTNPHILNIVCGVSDDVGILLQSLNEYDQLVHFHGKNHLPEMFSSPSVLSHNELQLWKETGVNVNVSSLEEVETLVSLDPKRKIFFRLDLSKGRKQRHGIKRSEIPELKKVFLNGGIEPEGFHIYVGTGSSLPKVLKETEDAFQFLMHHFPNLKLINLGGGFAFNYNEEGDGDQKHFDWDMYFQQLSVLLKKYGVPDDVKIHIEPGRDLLADTGMFLLGVRAKKYWRAGVSDLCVDGSYVHMPSATVRKRVHRVLFFDKYGRKMEKDGDRVRLAGPTTLSRDFVIPGIIDAPRGEVSYVAIGDVGAYASSQFMRFLNQRSAPEVLIREGGDIELLITRGDARDYQMHVLSIPMGISG